MAKTGTGIPLDVGVRMAARYLMLQLFLVAGLLAGIPWTALVCDATVSVKSKKRWVIGHSSHFCGIHV